MYIDTRMCTSAVPEMWDLPLQTHVHLFPSLYETQRGYYKRECVVYIAVIILFSLPSPGKELPTAMAVV